jgi:phosphopantothenoylcysteine synthetase/decarboxylase
MKKLAGLLLLAAAITASGCTGSVSDPEILVKDKLTIEGNSSQQVEIQVKNTYEEKSASFDVNITAPAIADVVDPENAEKVTKLDMGEATAGSKTVKKVVEVRANPEELGSLNSGTDQIRLLAIAEASGNLSEEQKFSRKNITVTVNR